MTATIARRPSPLADFARHEPLFTASALVFTLACLPVLMAAALDDRSYLDIPIWIKPLKFLISVATYLAMLAWAARWLPAGMINKRWYKAWSALIVFSAAAEILWITAAAGNGVGSHFNTSTPLLSFAYTMAGILAVTLLTGTLVYGVLIWRNPNTGLHPAFRMSLILGLIVTFPLTFVIAGYLGGAPSHFVGGNGSDAEGMILTGWARDGGDLRVGHFFALHAMHIIPAAGWALSRSLAPRPATIAVWAVTVGYCALTIFSFVQALMGQPFLPMIA